MQKYYDLFFSVTSRHKNRQKNDMQPEFSYFHWLKEAAKSKNIKVDPEKYKYEIMGGGPVAYISYSNNMEKNRPVLERHKTSTKTKVVFLSLIRFLGVTFVPYDRSLQCQKDWPYLALWTAHF